MAVTPLRSSQTSTTTTTADRALPTTASTTLTPSSTPSTTAADTTTTTPGAAPSPRLPIAETFAHNPPVLLPSPSPQRTPGPHVRSVSSVDDVKQHIPTSSLGSAKYIRSSLLTLSSLREKTTRSISSLSESSLRTRSSFTNLLTTQPSSPGDASPPADPRASLTSSTAPPITRIKSDSVLAHLAETQPPSKPYTETDSDLPPPEIQLTKRNKMHQTSSRLLRMTSDDRPFTRVDLPNSPARSFSRPFATSPPLSSAAAAASTASTSAAPRNVSYTPSPLVRTVAGFRLLPEVAVDEQDVMDGDAVQYSPRASSSSGESALEPDVSHDDDELPFDNVHAWSNDDEATSDVAKASSDDGNASPDDDEASPDDGASDAATVIWHIRDLEDLARLIRCAQDFKDLFSTLVVSLPLGPHRVRLTRVEHSFLSEEAINNLGSLKFSQSNRMPDPKDATRIVTTTTTTTFSMAKEMARSVCQRFLDARFIESADGRQLREFAMKGTTWMLTPKGIHVLEIFCGRNGIQQKHVSDLLQSPRNTMQLVVLERNLQTDRLSFDRGTIEVIFRRFIGQDGPNIKESVSAADSDSLSDYKDGLAGVKMARERKVGLPPRTFFNTFTGKGALEWLMDCCTTVDRKETIDLASAFLEQGFIICVQPDKPFLGGGREKDKDKDVLQFQGSKNAIYAMTQKGKDVIETSRERASEGEAPGSILNRAGVSRDSNTQKLEKILNDAALRLLFRENLRDTHCEENLSFYLDVCEFLQQCRLATTAAKGGNAGTRTASTKSNPQGLDLVKETMASAYGLYNAFLAPGSPCELNIDHLLRNQLATRMTKSVGQDAAMVDSLKEVTKLFEEAQVSVFKLMASDSVPKFIKTAKYEQMLKNSDLETTSLAPTTSASESARFNTGSRGGGAPERSLSKSNR